MRRIGYLISKQEAEQFSLFLLGRGITNEVELTAPDTFAIWVHSEDHRMEAEVLLAQFMVNPNDAVFSEGAVTGAKLQQKEKRILRRTNRTERFHPKRMRVASVVGHITLTVIVLCVLIFMLSDMGKKPAICNQLLISARPPLPGIPWWQNLTEIRSGQYWRLITPIFLHFNVLHILFNMLWLFDLGSMLERKNGSTFLVLFIAVVALFSNTTQYAFSGPMFGGMSGVVYGMLGYVWIKSRFSPEERLYLHPTTMTMMMIWLALGFFGLIGGVANIVHLSGLITGVVWGFASSMVKKLRDE